MRPTRFAWLLLPLFLLTTAWAVDPPLPPREREGERVRPLSQEGSGGPRRYVYVPYPDLDVIFGAEDKGVLLSREEYEKLRSAAEESARQLGLAGRAPVSAAILSARYAGQVTERQAAIDAAFDVEVLAPGGATLAIPFDLGGAAIDSARLGDQPALIGRDETGRFTLFMPDARPGRQTLTARLLARVETREHDSVLRLTLPQAPASQLTLTFEGDAEVSASAPVIERTFDRAANKTTVRFAVRGGNVGRAPSPGVPAPPGAPAPQATLVIAFVPNAARRLLTPLVLSDVTEQVTLGEGFARLDATLAYTVLREPVDQFTILLPAVLAITEVKEPNLLGWSAVPAAAPRTGLQALTVRLHRPQSSAAVQLSAHAEVKDLKGFVVPKPVTEGAAIERGVAVLVLPRDLEAREETLVSARRVEVPAGTTAGRPAASAARRAYAFWRPATGQSNITLDLTRVPTEVAAFNNLVLRLAEQELQLTTQVTLVPRTGRVYRARIRLPAEWVVIGVGTSRTTDRYLWQELKSADGKTKDIVVNLKHHLPPGEPLVVTIDAQVVPDGWLDRGWTERTVAVPEVVVLDDLAVRVSEVKGQFGVWADPEFTIAPQGLRNLDVVDARELKELDGGNLALGYTFDRQPAGGQLAVARRAPRLQVETLGFVSLQERMLRATFQLDYRVEQAGTDTFRFSVLDSPTGGKLAVRGVRPPDGSSAVSVKDWSLVSDSPDTGETWIVHTQKRHRGPVSLLVSFERELGENAAFNRDPFSRDPKGSAPAATVSSVRAPTLRVLDVDRQSGFLVVEGRDDTEITATATGLTEVDVSDVPMTAAYRPEHKVVAAFRYLSVPVSLTLSPTRHPEAAIPKFLVKRADLVSVVEATGRVRTKARFVVAMAEPKGVRVALAKGAVLWTAHVDGKPIKPQLIDGQLAVPVERVSPAGVELSVFYVQDIALPSALGLRSLALAPPRLPGIDTAEVRWDVYAPEEMRYLAATGDLTLDRPPVDRLAAWDVLSVLRDVVVAPFARAREQARRSYGGAYYAEPSMAVSRRPPPSPGERRLGVASSDYALEQADKMPAAEAEFRRAGRDQFRQGTRDQDADGTGEYGRPADTPTGGGIAGGARAPEPAWSATVVTRSPAEGPPPPPPAGSTMTLDVPLTTAGQVYHFRGLEGTGSARIAYMNSAAYRFLTYAAFGVVVVLGLFLSRVKGRRKALYVLAVLIVSSVAPSFVGSGFTTVANGAFWGGLVVAAWFILRWFGRVVITNPRFTPGPAVGILILVLVVGVVVLFAAVGAASGAEEKGVGDPTVKVPDPFFPGEGTVIIPYDPAHPERAKESGRVYLPYDRYVEMWNLAHPAAPIRSRTAPPVDALIHSAAYYGRLAVDENGERDTVLGTRVAFQAEFHLYVFKEGPVSVALPLRGVAVREATLDGAPTTIQVAPEGYRVLAGKPGGHVLRLLFLAPAETLGRTGRCAFAVPAVASALLELTVPAADLEVTVAPAAGGQTEDRTPAGSLVRAHLGPVERVGFSWQPTRAAAARQAAVTARITNLVTIDETAVRLAATVHYDVAQGERGRFTLALPPDFEVDRVLGDNVRLWRVVTETDTAPGRPAAMRRTLELTLHRPAATFDGTVSGFRAAGGATPAAADAIGEYPFPFLSTTDAGRETGTLGVRFDPVLMVTPKPPVGLEQVNPGEFQSALLAKGEGVQLAYRYARPPATAVALAAIVGRLPSPVQADGRTAVHVRKDELNYVATFDVTVGGSGVHRLRLRLPGTSPAGAAGPAAPTTFTVRDKEGSLLDNSFVTADPAGPILVANLSRPARAAVQVVVAGTLPKVTTETPTPLPRVEVLDTTRQTGAVAVSVAAGLEVSAARVQGLDSVDAATTATWANPAADERLVLAFRIPAGRTGAGGDLAVRLLSPRVTAESVAHVLIDDTFVAYRYAVAYRVENAGVRQFRFALPASAGDAVAVSGQRIRETTSAVEGSGPTARRVWTVTLQGEVLGEYQVFVYHETSQPGASLSVPRPDVLDAARAQNYVALQNTSRFEVRVRSVTVAEPVKPAELPILPQGTQAGDLLAAWRSVNGLWSVDLDLVAHKGREVQRDAVELMDATAVVERSGRALYRITYALSNRTRQFLELALPEGAKVWGVTVAGRPVKPLSLPGRGLGEGPVAAAPTPPGGPQPHLLIPLIKTAPQDLNYDAVLVYEGRVRGGFGKLGSEISPVLPSVVSMPVNKTVLTLFLPREYRYFNDRGNLERTASSERAWQRLEVLLGQQERLERLSKSGVVLMPSVHRNLWANYRLAEEQVQELEEANKEALEKSTGRGRARARELETALAATQQKLAQAQAQIQALQPQAQPGQVERLTVVARKTDLLDDIRSNAWAFNEMAPQTEEKDRLWQRTEIQPQEQGQAQGRGQTGDNYQRFMGRAQGLEFAGVPTRQPGPAARQRDVGSQVLALKNADPEKLAEIINRLTADQQGRAASARGLAAINPRERGGAVAQADVDNRAVILRGEPEDIATLTDLVKQLDAPPAAAMAEVRIIALKHADAAQVARALNQVMSARAGGKDGGRAAAERPTITVDARTNGLVVMAGGEDLKTITELVDQLDSVEQRERDKADRSKTTISWIDAWSQRRADLGTATGKPLSPDSIFKPLDLDAREGVAATVIDASGSMAQADTGLLSLVVDIPRQGVRLDFVKTLGDPDLTISVVDGQVVRMGTAGGVGLGLLFLALLITSWRGTCRFLRFLRVAVPLALVAAGVWGAVVGYQRAVAVGVAVAGAALFTWWLAAGVRRRQKQGVGIRV